MKAGMVDVGILCKEPRIGNNNEKGSVYGQISFSVFGIWDE